MDYSIQKILRLYDNNETLDYIFFWGHQPIKNNNINKSCLSQWYECTFTSDGRKYHTAEQYMMAQKALLFHDKKIFDKIMESTHPKQYKILGRKISDFDEHIWQKNRENIVIKGNSEKFKQNPELKKYLLSTDNRVLVEASPFDTIWGIGLKENTKNIENPHTWKGKNLLGFCLMEVRHILNNT